MRVLLCAFDDRGLAEAAMRELAARGLPRDNVHMQADPSTLPGEDGTYRDAIRNGHPVVVVHVADKSEAARAADLMARLGAFDIEQRAATWSTAG